MFGSNLRDILTEQEAIQRRQRALKSLLVMRHRRMRESLEQRIKRAHREGAWQDLTRAECQALHNEEKAFLQDQLSALEVENRRGQGKLLRVRREKARAQRQRAALAIESKKRANA